MGLSTYYIVIFVIGCYNLPQNLSANGAKIVLMGRRRIRNLKMNNRIRYS